MADPQGALSIAFDDIPLEADPDWTRIDTLEGCRVREWTIDRGRPNELAKTDTGTAVVRIVDREGLFDPTNSSSAYYSKVLPGKQAAIALQNPVSDAWFTMFRGFVESWRYELDRTLQFMELELQLVDGFAILSRAELIPGVHGVVPLPTGVGKGNILYGHTDGTVSDRINAVLEDIGWPEDLSTPGVDIFTGNVRVGPKVYGPGTSALDALWDAADAEFPGVANLFMSKDGHLSFRGRQARFRPDVAEYGIQRRTVATPPHTELDPDYVPLSELEWSLGQDNLFNAASATPERIAVVADVGPWRQLNPDPPDNDNVDGQFVRAGDPGVLGDADSIAKYGLRSITFDQLQTVKGIATGSTAMVETKKFARYYVENFSEAQPRITRMVFKSRRPGNTNGSALWLHLCKCEISDLLTLKSEHPGDGFFDQGFYVEGLHYTCRPGPPAYPVIELALDVSPQAHYTTNPFDEDTDP